MMNDDMLSQDEIDALLNGSGIDEEDSNEQSSSNQHVNVDEYLSELEQDALGEIGNISFGSSATALSSLLNQKVEITTPTTRVVDRNRLHEEFPKPNVAIKVTYTDGFSGENLLIIHTEDAAVIADLMLGGDGSSPADELNEIHLSAVQEAMNQMMGSAATSMSTVFEKRVDISPPVIDMLDIPEDEGLDYIPDENILVKISFNLKVGNLIDSNIMQLLPYHFAKELVDQLLNPAAQENHAGVQQLSDKGQTPSPMSSGEESHSSRPTSHSRQHPTTKAEASRQDAQLLGGNGQPNPDTAIQSAQFSDFGNNQMVSNEQRNLDMLLDIPLKVTVELGRAKRTIKDILELSSGSVVELDKLAGEPVDIHVNNKLIAQGEVVVIDENFGVRVTDILSPKDRLKKIK
ncbi:flagellar motor switch protein FliN/FliY [Thalassobacillus cyri]|uniref:Flagellar motor switch protein FliN/FliY n=1 Tax=Thalassobacillus cyri TaxID=571932 RepID=A0A1H4G0V0_9BACI|nr:flagellar motor switch phosphatase FliY [Thalassobacillus cyri]SEB03195.1 flagellar motor switch protein FliN/FliY [Thalassobacillus cyri]